jgi:hypothetical protein
MTTKFDEMRREYADSPDILAMLDRDEANYPKVIPPCPDWCRFREIFPTGLHSDHGYDSSEEWDAVITYMRFHISGVAGLHISQEEINRGGEVTLGTPCIFGLERNDEELSSEQARQLAAELLNVADRLDEVTAVGE